MRGEKLAPDSSSSFLTKKKGKKDTNKEALISKCIKVRSKHHFYSLPSVTSTDNYCRVSNYFLLPQLFVWIPNLSLSQASCLKPPLTNMNTSITIRTNISPLDTRERIGAKKKLLRIPIDLIPMDKQENW